MVNKVKKRLDDYLEFDSDEIFKCGDPLIYGGAIRDSIANMGINDVDIVAGPNTVNKLNELLTQRGYERMDTSTSKKLGFLDLYLDASRIMSEPLTYTNNRVSVVQLIRPRASHYLMSKYPDSVSWTGRPSSTVVDYKEVCDLFVREVDLSCCGVSYNGKELIQNYNNSILHCENKVFIVNEGALMKTDRLNTRKMKLKRRGWVEIEKNKEREFLIDNILTI